MRINLEPTTKKVAINSTGYEATMWQGVSDEGVPVMALVAVLVPILPVEDAAQVAFEEALDKTATPIPEVERYPERVVL